MKSSINKSIYKSIIKAERCRRRLRRNIVKSQHRSLSLGGKIQPALSTACTKGVKNSNKSLINENLKRVFGSYLAGLFDANGHIWIPKPNLKKRHNPRFCITFNLKDEPLANKLLENIGFGHIRYKPEDNACVLIVSPVKGLKKIIAFINGELRTPKINQLHSLID